MQIGGKYLKSHKETWTTGTSLVVTHNFNTSDVLVIVRDIDNGTILTAPTGWGDYEVGASVTSVNSVIVSASAAPSGSGYRVIVVPL